MDVVGTLGLRAVWEIGKSICVSIPKGITKWKFERFWGPGSTNSDAFYFVFDPYSHPAPRPNNRYIKRFLGRRTDQVLQGEDDVLGVNALRILNYAATSFALNSRNGKPIQVVLDSEAINAWKGTFVCFGSADSNIRTLEIERLPEQIFYKMVMGAGGIAEFEVGGKRYQLNQEGQDIGIVLRMKNPHSEGNWLFVCCGLGEWGTSGAAYFLLTKWPSLAKRFGKNEFCIVVSVSRGSDDSARVISDG